MYVRPIPDAVQLGPPASGGVQAWGCSIPGGLLLLDAGGGAADDAAAAGDGAAQPAGPCGGLESSAYNERWVLNYTAEQKKNKFCSVYFNGFLL